MTIDFKLGIIGCGTMGVAILTGLLDTATIKPEQVVCSTSSAESARHLNDKFGEKLCALSGPAANLDLCKAADVVILCVKPQMAKQVLDSADIVDALTNKLLISICAGVKISQLKTWLPQTAIIRAMPNTPCKIRHGMTVMSTATQQCRVSATHRANAEKIFSVLGRSRFIEEKHMDAVTGLSGSGPAFACVVLESLADGGVMMGLPRDVAIELAAQAISGAAQMVLQTGEHPSVIKDGVTTPAGCTIAGLLMMEDGKIRSTLARAVQEATQVAGGLGNDTVKK